MNLGQKLGVTGIFVILICLVSTASAALEYLPDSSHHQGVALVDGRLVEFAVYDTEAYPDEFTADIPGENPGRYVYAYQIFNTNEDPVTNFNLIGIGEDAINSYDMLGTVDDGSDGIDATGAFFNIEKTEGLWLFDGSLFIKGKHSVFLVLSSDHNYGPTQAEINVTDFGDVTVPAPEPATLVMLALGSTMFFVKKRK